MTLCLSVRLTGSASSVGLYTGPPSSNFFFSFKVRRDFSTFDSSHLLEDVWTHRTPQMSRVRVIVHGGEVSDGGGYKGVSAFSCGGCWESRLGQGTTEESEDSRDGPKADTWERTLILCPSNFWLESLIAAQFTQVPS